MWTVRSALLLILAVQLVLLIASVRGCAQISHRLDEAESALAARVEAERAATMRNSELRAALTDAEQRLQLEADGAEREVRQEVGRLVSKVEQLDALLQDTVDSIGEEKKRLTALQSQVEKLKAPLRGEAKPGGKAEARDANVGGNGNATAPGKQAPGEDEKRENL